MKELILPKTLFYLTGLPGSGKTTFALNLIAYTNVKHVSLDRIAYVQLNTSIFNQNTKLSLVISEGDYQVEDYLSEGKPVIYDGNFNTKELREHLVRLSKRFGVPLVCIYIASPNEVCHKRALTPRYGKITSIVRVLTEKQYDKAQKEFVEPRITKNMVTISGQDKFGTQFKEFKGLVEKIKN
jgi:predicted kinase